MGTIVRSQYFTRAHPITTCVTMATTVFIVPLILALVGVANGAGGGPSFAPYFDVTLDRPNLVEYMQTTGQKDFTLAFALGGIQGCYPMWGAQIAIDEPSVLDPIKAVQAAGGQMVVATGGAVGPYLEHICSTSEDLAEAYKVALDVVGTTHLDVDIEAPINNDLVNRALAQVQRERPETTVSYTVMIQGEDYGMVPDLGVAVLESAKANGVRVDLVNAMTMEFPGSSPEWGDSVINAARATLRQMGAIWPEKSETELKAMLGVTPMIGRNFNGKVFETRHGRQLVEWGNAENIAHLSFWSIGRDNGDCPDGTLSPYCSGTTQGPQEFTNIFQGFRPTQPGTTTVGPTTTRDPTATTPTTTRPPTTTPPSRECTVEGIDGVKCETEFWNCVMEGGTLVKYTLHCGTGTVYDPSIKGCNFPAAVGCGVGN